MTKQRNIITLPERYWNAIDNEIDGEQINNRGEALLHLLVSLQKANPIAMKFEKKTETYSLPKWCTKEVFNNIKTILNISDDANETTVVIALETVQMALKAWKYMDGSNGLAELRRYRAEQKAKDKKQTNNNPVLCECGHVLEVHSDERCLANGGMCECKKYEEGTPS